jgi:hypothetical protein
MKKFFKYLFYFFVASAILNGIIESFKEEPIRQDSGNEEIVERESGKKEEIKDKESKPQEKYTAISTITDINGKWKYGDDIILFDSYRRVVQFNSGPEMKMDFIDATNKPDYPNQEFYVYGTIGTTKIFRTRVLINQSKNTIYLDRVDGNTPHYYRKVKELTKEATVPEGTKVVSKNERLQIIADSILQTIPITSYQSLFNDIALNEDRVLEIAKKMHPDPNDYMAEREAQLVLEEQYFKRWAEAKFSWYKTLELPEEDKYSVVSKIRAKISGIGVRNGWLDEYDQKK